METVRRPEGLRYGPACGEPKIPPTRGSLGPTVGSRLPRAASVQTRYGHEAPCLPRFLLPVVVDPPYLAHSRYRAEEIGYGRLCGSNRTWLWHVDVQPAQSSI